nr:hypothetical protein [Brucella anthropi]
MENKDWIPVVGIGVSLVWNLFNSILVHRSWKNTNKLTDFRRIREPVDKAIIELRAVKREVRNLQGFGGAEDEFKQLFEGVNQRISESYNLGLCVSLEALDGSLHVSGGDWEAKANEKWDDVNDKMNLLYTSLPKTQRLDALQKLERSLDALISCISGRLDNVTNSMLKFWRAPRMRELAAGVVLLALLATYWAHQKSVSAEVSKAGPDQSKATD